MEPEAAGYIRSIGAVVNTLTVAKMKIALRSLSSSTTGRKAELQERIMLCTRGQDPKYLHDFLAALEYIDRYNQAPVTPMSSYTYTQRVNNILQTTHINGGHRGYPVGAAVQPMYAQQPSHANNMPEPGLNFDLAPFHSVVQKVSRPTFLYAPHNRRSDIEVRLVIPNHLIPKVQTNELKLMFLCANISRDGPTQLVYYPFNCSITLNGVLVSDRGSLTRGLKGKEGTVRPLDLTAAWSRSPPHQRSSPVLKFIMTADDPAKDDGTRNKSFGFCAYLVQTHEVKDLVQILKDRQHITLEQDIKIIKGDEEDDIVTTQAVHSLKDPLILTRMQLPIRSKNCQHVDCVDAEAFLSYLSHSPRWYCPICNSPITWESLAVDNLMLGILQKTKPQADKVSINEDGTWNVISTDSDSEEDDSDEDVRPTKIHKLEPEIIDLLSDSEDEAPTPPPPPPPPPAVQPPQQQRALPASSNVNLLPPPSVRPPTQVDQPEEAACASTTTPTPTVAPAATPTANTAPAGGIQSVPPQTSVASSVPPSAVPSQQQQPQQPQQRQPQAARSRPNDVSSDELDEDIQIPDHLDLSQSSHGASQSAAQPQLTTESNTNGQKAPEKTTEKDPAPVEGSSLPSIDKLQKTFGKSLFSSAISKLQKAASNLTPNGDEVRSQMANGQTPNQAQAPITEQPPAQTHAQVPAEVPPQAPPAQAQTARPLYFGSSTVEATNSTGHNSSANSSSTNTPVPSHAQVSAFGPPHGQFTHVQSQVNGVRPSPPAQHQQSGQLMGPSGNLNPQAVTQVTESPQPYPFGDTLVRLQKQLSTDEFAQLKVRLHSQLAAQKSAQQGNGMNGLSPQVHSQQSQQYQQNQQYQQYQQQQQQQQQYQQQQYQLQRLQQQQQGQQLMNQQQQQYGGPSHNSASASAPIPPPNSASTAQNYAPQQVQQYNNYPAQAAAPAYAPRPQKVVEIVDLTGDDDD